MGGSPLAALIEQSGCVWIAALRFIVIQKEAENLELLDAMRFRCHVVLVSRLPYYLRSDGAESL